MSALRRIKPLADRVLVQRVKAQEKTASGILIPEKAQETMQEGIVIAVGPGALDQQGKRVSMSLNAGDDVILPSYGGSQVKVGSEEYLLFREAEILGKLEK